MAGSGPDTTGDSASSTCQWPAPGRPLAGAYNGDTYRCGWQPPSRYLRVESVIRANPRRWLLFDDARAETFDDAEDAAIAWLWSHDTPAATCIDLWSVPR